MNKSFWVKVEQGCRTQEHGSNKNTWSSSGESATFTLLQETLHQQITILLEQPVNEHGKIPL